MTKEQIRQHGHWLLYIISTNKGKSMSEIKLWRASKLSSEGFNAVIAWMLKEYLVTRDRMKDTYFEFNIRARGFELLESNAFASYRTNAEIALKMWLIATGVEDDIPFDALPKQDAVKFMKQAIVDD